MKRFLVIVLFLTPVLAFGTGEFGFLKQNIWISPDPVFVGENIRIYSVLFNGLDTDISGRIIFYDNNVEIDGVDFTLAKGSPLRDIWLDFTAREGEHIFSAKIEQAFASRIDGSQIEIDFADQVSGNLNKSIDVDTDGDRIGDKEDEDDDNDGLSDEREIELGSNPKKADTDGDGLLDGVDSSPLTFNLQIGTEEFEDKLIDKGEAEKTVAAVSANALSALEKFRQEQIIGLGNKKDELKKEINQDKINVAQDIEDVAVARNKDGEKVNDLLGQEIFLPTEKDSGLPNLSLTRILKQIYLGVIYIGLFIFEHKWLFYIVLGLIALKFLAIIFKRVFKRD